MNGVDLSHYQEGLDLSALKRGGYSFAILKLSEGRGIADASFDKFYDMAQSHGIPVGAYVYSHATNASVAQAEAVYALSLLKGRVLQLGIYMDVETVGQMQIPKAQLAETVKAFCATVNRAGYDAGIYGSEYNAWSRLSPEDLGEYLIWIAHYGKEPDLPCDIWQKTDKGTFPGYNGPVDVDEVRSGRMRELVDGMPIPDPETEREQDAETTAIVRMLQACMSQNGFWPADQCDGVKSAEFRKTFVEYANAVAKS